MRDSFTHLVLPGFELGPLYIHTWGLMAALGFLLAIKLATGKFRQLKQQDALSQLDSIEEKTILEFSFNLLLAILLGSRILFVLEEWPLFARDLGAIFRIWEGGFSFFGGVFGALVYSSWWAKKNKISFSLLGEIFTPAWIFGLAVGRFGCFLIHDHLGRPTKLPWAMWIEGMYRHEPALYEFIFLSLLGIVIYFGQQKKRTEKIFLISLTIYAVGRFGLDFFRAAAIGGGDARWLSLTLAQWFSLTIALLGLFFYLKGRKSLLFLKNNSTVKR